MKQQRLSSSLPAPHITTPRLILLRRPLMPVPRSRDGVWCPFLRLLRVTSVIEAF